MVTLDECGWAASAIRLDDVPPTLASYVEQIFVIDFRRAHQSSWKVLPDTCGHLLAHLYDGGPRTGCRVAFVGARTRAIDVDVSTRRWSVGVRFRPGGLATLLREPAVRLTDRSVQPGSALGSVGDDLARDTGGAEDPDFVKHRIVSVLEARAESAGPVDWRAEAFASLVKRSRGTTSVASAASRMGLATRTLRSATAEELGLPPKRYARIERLFTALIARRGMAWAEVATHAGFSDQAHLVREFRDLLGETPTRFASRGSSMPIRSRPASR